MTNFEELIKIATITLLFALPLLLLTRWYLKHQIKLKELELANNTFRELIPTRMQAYERLAILLERITPESLVLREQNHSLTSLQLQQKLLQIVRHEFEHNFAMQIYLPVKSWEAVTKSRDEVIKLINTCAGAVKPTSPALELSKTILERSMNETNFYVVKAKEKLKNDIQQYYFD
jgi:hypothetical protein